jgi:hypothetical protein
MGADCLGGTVRLLGLLMTEKQFAAVDKIPNLGQRATLVEVEKTLDGALMPACGSSEHHSALAFAYVRRVKLRAQGQCRLGSA